MEKQSNELKVKIYHMERWPPFLVISEAIAFQHNERLEFQRNRNKYRQNKVEIKQIKIISQ